MGKHINKFSFLSPNRQLNKLIKCVRLLTIGAAIGSIKNAVIRSPHRIQSGAIRNISLKTILRNNAIRRAAVDINQRTAINAFRINISSRIQNITLRDRSLSPIPKTAIDALHCFNFIQFEKSAGEWLADGWLWISNDCKRAYRSIHSLALEIKTGRWPVGQPCFLTKPYFYRSVFFMAILLMGNFYIVQKHPVYIAAYAGNRIETMSSSMAGSQLDQGWNAGKEAAGRQQNTAPAAGKPATNNCKLEAAEDVVNVRSGPGKNEPEIGQVRYGDVLQAKAESDNGWYQIQFNGEAGWVAGWCVQGYRPGSQAGHPASPSGEAGGGYTAAPEASRGTNSGVVGIARRYLGTPYVYGANGPSCFDCSGFVRYVFARGGIGLPRVASDQARAGTRVSSPAPGDLVFFSDRSSGYITHVGIYVGNNCFIHASFSGVTITSLGDPWYRSHYVMACRIG